MDKRRNGREGVLDVATEEQITYSITMSHYIHFNLQRQIKTTGSHAYK